MKLCVWSPTASGHNRLSEFFGGWGWSHMLAGTLPVSLPPRVTSAIQIVPLACLSDSFPTQMAGLRIFVLGNILASWRVSLDFDLILITDWLVLIGESSESVLSASGKNPREALGAGLLAELALNCCFAEVPSVLTWTTLWTGLYKWAVHLLRCISF